MKSLIALTSALMLGTVACGRGSSSSDKTVADPKVDTPSVDVTEGALETSPVQTPHSIAPFEVVTFEVDARDKATFVHLDLDTGKIVPEADASWDLAFKKTVIKMNADVQAQVVIDGTFDAILAAPGGDYLADVPVAGGKETDGLVFHSGLGWYTYDMDSHLVSSNGYVYFVRTNAGAEFKLSTLDYYNVDRLAGYIQLKWLKVAPTPQAE